MAVVVTVMQRRCPRFNEPALAIFGGPPRLSRHSTGSCSKSDWTIKVIGAPRRPIPTEMCLVEIADPKWTHPRNPDLFDVPLLRFFVRRREEGRHPEKVVQAVRAIKRSGSENSRVRWRCQQT
ncbi:hypothetical protein GCM10010530_58980 [Kribbella aluminosa]